MKIFWKFELLQQYTVCYTTWECSDTVVCHQDEWNCVTEWVQTVMEDRIWRVIHMAAERNNKKKASCPEPQNFHRQQACPAFAQIFAAECFDGFFWVCHHFCNWTLNIISGHMQPSAFFQTQDSLKDYCLSSVISGLESYLLKSFKGVWIYSQSHQSHLFFSFFCHCWTHNTGSVSPDGLEDSLVASVPYWMMLQRVKSPSCIDLVYTLFPMDLCCLNKETSYTPCNIKHAAKKNS